MDKRNFLAAAVTAGLLPVPASAVVKPKAKAGPALLTVGGAIGKGNRGPVDAALDQMMLKHGVQFTKALALDAEALRRLPAVSIQPTLEYDSKPHKLTGPLLLTVLSEAGVDLKAGARIGLRAVDGYNVNISVDQVRAYRMIIATELDDHPLGLGGLGPQWAVFEPQAVPEFKDKPVKEQFALCPWGLYYIDVARA